MKKRYRFIPAVLLFILISCHNDGKITREVESVKVKITHARQIEYIKEIRTSGILASKEQQKLSFKTGGIIGRIYFDEGDLVQKGDVIASLDLLEINAKVTQAKLSLEKAYRDFQRIDNLYSDSVATLEQLQNAQTALDYALANHEIANFNKKHSIITAPEDGKVLKRLVEENEVIGSGYPVVLYSLKRMDWVVRCHVSDVDIVQIQYGDSATIHFDAFKEDVFHARVSEIAGAADPYTGTFEIELSLQNMPSGLLSGMIAKVYITSSLKKSLIKIPVEALIEGNESVGYTYILKDGNPVKSKIHITAIQDEYVLVKSGICDHDTIITEGINYIKPGSQVEIIE